MKKTIIRIVGEGNSECSRNHVCTDKISALNNDDNDDDDVDEDEKEEKGGECYRGSRRRLFLKFQSLNCSRSRRCGNLNKNQYN